MRSPSPPTLASGSDITHMFDAGHRSTRRPGGTWQAEAHGVWMSRSPARLGLPAARAGDHLVVHRSDRHRLRRRMAAPAGPAVPAVHDVPSSSRTAPIGGVSTIGWFFVAFGFLLDVGSYLWEQPVPPHHDGQLARAPAASSLSATARRHGASNTSTPGAATSRSPTAGATTHGRSPGRCARSASSDACAARCSGPGRPHNSAGWTRLATTI